MPKRPTTASGRKAALQALDTMLGRPKNVQALTKALQDLFDVSPAMFFKDFVMPLTPKESLVHMDTKETRPVRLVLCEKETKGAKKK